MNHLIILRGPTSAGKSSVASILSRRLGFKDIDIDKVAANIPRSETGDLSDHFERYERALAEACYLARRYIKKGTGVIIHEAFAEHACPEDVAPELDSQNSQIEREFGRFPYIRRLQSHVVEPLQKLGVKPKIFCLTCSLEAALNRNKARKTPIPDEEIVWQHRRFEESNEYGIRIDTSDLSVEDVVGIIESELANQDLPV